MNQTEETGNLCLEEELLMHKDATLGHRFFNFIIDNIIIHVAFAYVVEELFLLLVARSEQDEATYTVLNSIYFLIILFSAFIYYTFCEKVFKGVTPGKFITRTRAVRLDGTDLSFRDAFLRSLSRLVPFEPFSALGGNPWHDRWTDTRVVKVRKGIS